ncbi:MAG: hypothetical protein ACRDM7_14835 [Thermoleophilaceae bacterium]
MSVTDFEFLPDVWRVANRKLVDTLDPACAESRSAGRGSVRQRRTRPL